MKKRLLRGYLSEDHLQEMRDEFDGKFVRITIEEVDPNDIREQRTDEFIKRFEEAFGEKIKLNPKMTDEEKMNSGDYTYSYNVYGVKSKYL